MIFLICCGFGAVHFASASVPISKFQDFKNDKSFKLYITGVGKGTSWANAELDQQGRRLLYCQPKKLALNGSNYIQLIDNFLDHHKNLPSYTPIEMVLLLALENAFPCP